MIDFKRLLLSFRYAYIGILHAVANDQNVRIHFLISIIVLSAAFFFHLTYLEMWVVCIMILLVLLAEMVNTSIEQMVDLITQEHKQEARIAKDVSAGMVLFAVLASVIVGLLIFVPHVVVFLFPLT